MFNDEKIEGLEQKIGMLNVQIDQLRERIERLESNNVLYVPTELERDAGLSHAYWPFGNGGHDVRLHVVVRQIIEHLGLEVGYQPAQPEKFALVAKATAQKAQEPHK